VGKIIEGEDKLTVLVDDKYLKSDIFNHIDELFIGAVKYLRKEGKSCEFQGFNILNEHVLLIDGIKYHTQGDGVYDIETLSYETFVIVYDEDHDYIENRLRDRINIILQELGDIK
jgi:hypothetical protein